MSYYNATLVDYSGNKFVTFHNISNPQAFVNWCIENKNFRVILFYRLAFRNSKETQYSGTYTNSKGFSFSP